MGFTAALFSPAAAGASITRDDWSVAVSATNGWPDLAVPDGRWRRNGVSAAIIDAPNRSQHYLGKGRRQAPFLLP